MVHTKAIVRVQIHFIQRNRPVARISQ